MTATETTTPDAKNSGDTNIRYSTFIIFSLLLMAVVLLYVWCHLHMRQLEYRVAEEMGMQERLLEEQKRLKVEYATLKSPQRIEAIARDKLQMSYPEREQVVILK
ncbi:MAG: cell division protein FtsL [Deltaproteobacteria bacterium]|nr:cell division protein FtsL [Deltaproteobacteria bacterium]